MKIAIIERIENDETAQPFNKKFYLSSYFQEIFEQLEVLLVPVVSEKFLEEVCKICDGLLVTGSTNDIHPKYYHEPVIEGKVYKYDEFPMVKKAVELFSKANKPILGICTGIQEINVVFGGTLNQVIENHELKEGETHKVRVQKDSLLYNIYKKESMKVNSYHKQSIKKLAPHFKVTSISSDGIIESIEKDNILAVQWHPEVVFDRKLFEKFIDICNKNN